MTDKAILTCALNGVLTNPAQHRVPVTPAQMADAARGAFNEGAAVMHVHFRDQRPGFGQLPTWDADIAADCGGGCVGAAGVPGAVEAGDCGVQCGEFELFETEGEWRVGLAADAV